MLRRLLGDLLQAAGAALARTDPPAYFAPRYETVRRVGDVGLTAASDALIREGTRPDERPEEAPESPLAGSLEARKRDLPPV